MCSVSKKNIPQLRMRFNSNFYLLRNKIMNDRKINNSSSINNEILSFIINDLKPILSEIIPEGGQDIKEIDVRCLLEPGQKEAINYICESLNITDKNIYLIGLIVMLFKERS